MADEEPEDLDLEYAEEGELEEGAALAADEDEIASLKEQMLRIAAEAENTKRRAEREANDARAYAIQKFARDLLGVADNLSRALQHAPRESAEPAVKNLVVGLEMTERELQSVFERNGLKRLNPARGDKFDPNFHQAMMEQTAEDVAPGGVIQVMQTGYELMGRVVRPAMVVVADKTSGSALGGGPAPKDGYQTNGGGAGEQVDTKA